MSDQPRARNEVRGEMIGSLVQAGSVDHVSLASFPAREQPVAPRQLPMAVRDFTGRIEHLAELDAVLPHDDTGDGRRDAVLISAVDGTAGVGKTTLAVHWAHRVQPHFPDGTLYANLRGYGPGEPATPEEVLSGFLAALGISPDRIPTGAEARAGLYRSVLARRRVLIVLDNAHTVEQIRPLLPGETGCVVVTSRASLAGLEIGEGATRITLDLLTGQEALDLVRTILGPRRADAEPEAVTELIRLCVRLPLALRVAAGRAVAHPYLSIADVVTELRSERGPWDALSVPADDHMAVRAVFDWSYRRLTDEQARMFRRLGLHPGPEISLHAAAAVSGLQLADARRLLNALAEGNLIEQTSRDRYRFHDLLRAYAADRAEPDDAAGEVEYARRALLEWYAHHTKMAFRVIFPQASEMFAGADLETHGCPEMTFSGRAQAWAWVDLELVNTLAAVRATAHHDLDELTIPLAGVLEGALGTRGLWNSVFEVCRLGLAAARRIGDRTAECHLLRGLGRMHQNIAQWQEAISAFQAALVLARELERTWLQAVVLADLGSAYIDQERYADAREYLRLALPLSPGSHHGLLECFIESNLSVVCTGLGDHEQAFRHAERGLSLVRQTGHPDFEFYALHYMARARQGIGAHQEAIALCDQALSAIGPHFRDPKHHAYLLDTLGTSLLRTGNTARALTCWRQALAIFDDLSDHRAQDLRDRLHTLETSERGNEARFRPQRLE